MLLRFRRLRHISRFLPQIYYYSGTSYRLSGTGTNHLAAAAASSACSHAADTRKVELVGYQWGRYSTVSETKTELLSAVDVLSFIQSSLQEPEGSAECWMMNRVHDSKSLLKEDGTILVIVGEYLESYFKSDQSLLEMFGKLKLLQLRYPSLKVLAMFYSRTISLNDISAHLLQRIKKEYVTFPVFLTHKNNFEMGNGPCCILSKSFQDHVVYSWKDVDIKKLGRAIQESGAQYTNGTIVQDTKSTWAVPGEVLNEPDVCSASQNLLFSFPGCISVDEGYSHFFLSDVNHHRIIVFNSDGEILDAIGSDPGFEDGEFENAKLMRPAASFYNASDDCLYFIDSENHAIRRADMEKRVVETVFHATRDATKKKKGLWKWILDKIWTKGKEKLKPDEFNCEAFLFPWHLLKSSDNDVYVLTQSFGTLWNIDLEAGLVKEVVTESSKILEICGQMIMEKSSPLDQLPADFLQQHTDTDCSFEGIRYAGLMSSATTFQDHVIFCDAVGQKVLKFNKGSGSLTSLQFSNFGSLGLPYWLSFPLEQVCAPKDVLSRVDVDHLQNLRLLPGRVDIEINVDIPQHTDLVELPKEECIWRQARGAAAEVSGIHNKAASTEKVGISQEWYDQVDTLFSTTEEDTSIDEEEARQRDARVQDNKVCIRCTVNTSPGTSEVIIYAALYLRLKKNPDLPDDSHEKKAARLADILDPMGRFRKDLLVQLLATSNRDLEELVFLKPLHVKLPIDTLRHPKADNSKDIILTDSSLKVHVTL